jgi:hypothetical protein
MKADPLARLVGRSHELSDRIENSPELGVVFLLQFLQFAGKISVVDKMARN